MSKFKPGDKVICLGIINEYGDLETKDESGEWDCVYREWVYSKRVVEITENNTINHFSDYDVTEIGGGRTFGCREEELVLAKLLSWKKQLGGK